MRFLPILLILFSVQTTLVGATDCGLKLPCRAKRTEIAFPRVHDVTGRVTFHPEGDLNVNKFSGLLHVTLKWRRQRLEVILYKNQVTSQETHTEWNEGNLTYASASHRDCFYQGYVKDQSRSYAAISSCNGLAGYIQTDDELLYIHATEKAISTSAHGRDLAHVIYTCESRQKAIPEPNWDNQSTARHLSRRRRAAKKPKYLEVMVAIDPSVVAAVGTKEKTQDYVMVLMNIANTVYQHHSLKVDIRVVVSKMVFLTKRQQRQVVKRNNAFATVNMFCEWSRRQIPYGAEPHYDVSVLLTKETLGPSGYAPITGLCNPVRSCAAVREEGFSTGFIIAHEVAHVFGVFHDGHGNNCHGGRYRSAMMAAMVESKLNHFWWSPCSNRRFQEMVPYLYCLNNEPRTMVEDHYELKSPAEFEPVLGRPFSLDFQCKMEFGDYFRLCGVFYNDPCSMLWCSRSDHPHLCRTKRGPPMPGSKCGRDRECMEERCQYVGNMTPRDGNWGSWGRWTDCSSDCGVGIRRRTRACDSPAPAYDGKECEGPESGWETCLNESCESFTDPRKGECAIWDGLQIRHGTHKWQPFEAKNSSSLCKQTCQSTYTREVVTIDVEVGDGAPCSYTGNNSNICLEGKCLNVGCDGVLNSSKREDRCGVCGGDGSTCKVVEGLYTKPTKTGDQYFPVITLPSGSRDIRIEETIRSAHFLALKDPRYGTFGLGGKKRQSPAFKFVYAGAMFEYKLSTSKINETIITPGPLRHNIIVMVFPNKHVSNTSILFRYTVPQSDYTFERNKYTWKFNGWSPCSVTCGQGKQSITHKCMDKATGAETEEEKCKFLTTPRKDSVSCVRENCGLVNFNFAMSPEYDECEAKCGEKGIKRQKYFCEQITLNGGNPQRVDMSLCSHLTPPNFTKICRAPPCNFTVKFQWSAAEEWSECICGDENKQTRTVKCQKIITEKTSGPDKVTVKETETDDCQDLPEKPKATRSCQDLPCVSIKFQWLSSDRWTECPCGNGNSQTRNVTCQKVVIEESGTGQETVTNVDREQCSSVPEKPATSRACDGEPCPAIHRFVMGRKYGRCNAECGERGVQTKVYFCEEAKQEGARFKRVDLSACSHLTAPNVTRQCWAPVCRPITTYQWKVAGEWSDCPCGDESTQSRELTCERVKTVKRKSGPDRVKTEGVSNAYCRSLRDTPDTSKPCEGQPCPPVFEFAMANKYGECEAECGRLGKQVKEYYCKQITGRSSKRVEISACSHLTPPKVTRRCRAPRCKRITEYRWKEPGKWSECPCGEKATQKRKVDCERVIMEKKRSGAVVKTQYRYASAAYCRRIPDKPASKRPCQGKPCPPVYQWSESSSYGPCKATCGRRGRQTRKLICKQVTREPGSRRRIYRQVDIGLCPENKKPRARARYCKAERCSKTTTTPSTTTTTTTTTTASTTARTTTTTTTRTTATTTASTTVSTTASTSASTARDTPRATPAEVTRPQQSVQKTQESTKTYRWRLMDEWEDCRAACDMQGKQSRVYRCQEVGDNGKSRDVTDDNCEVRKLEVETRTCKGPPCPLQWSIGFWSDCSVTCGTGERHRSVHCGDPGTDSDDFRCTADPPVISRKCKLTACPQLQDENCVDKYSSCSSYRALRFRCKRSSFRQKCCKTCLDRKRAAKRRNKNEGKTSWHHFFR